MERGKKDKASKYQDDPVINNVATLAQLKEETINCKFKLLDTFTEPITLPLVRGNKEHLMGVIYALRHNTSVKKLIFASYKWQPDEMSFLCESLFQNRGIKELDFNIFGFFMEFMEILVRILKRNTTIKSIVLSHSNVPADSWMRFCDGLEYYNFESFKVESIRLNASQLKALCEGLRYNQIIRSLIFTGELFPGDSFDTLAKTLEHQPTIEKLEISQCSNRLGHPGLDKLIKANYLKVLRLDRSPWEMVGENLKQFAAEIQNNTSITELSISGSSISTKVMGNILAKNKTIKKLDLIYWGCLNKDDIEDLGLRHNTTITDLNLSYCHNMPLSSLLKELTDNKTLKILRIGNNPIICPDPFEDYLAKTTTLRELHIENPYNGNLDGWAKGIAKGLKVNKSLRKLVAAFVNVPWEILDELVRALQFNQTLTYLDIGLQQRTALYGQPYSQSAIHSIWELLKTNNTIRHLVGAEKMDGFKRNRDAQDLITKNLCVWITMIKMRPNASILPSEVWSNIFKHCSSFVPFDFENFFKNDTNNSTSYAPYDFRQ